MELGLEILETVHDDVEVGGEELLVEKTVDFDGDCVLKGDLVEFIHLLNIFIFGCY